MEYCADLIWTDHPAWCAMPGARTRVIDLPDTSRYVAVARDRHLDVIGLDVVHDTVTIDQYRVPDDPPAGAAELVKALAGLGTVVRVRTADLWEAIGAQLCHHPAVAAPQRAYKHLCQHLGEPVPVPDSPRYAMFPTPDTIADETPVSLAGTGLGEAAGLLIDAAEVYMRRAPDWHTAPPKDLIRLLPTVHGIDERAARLITVDITSDFSFYPHDAQFRAWAAHAAPGIDWPKGARDFTRQWQHLTADHASTLTALSLAQAHKPSGTGRAGQHHRH